jgi:hypothetical protein
MIELIADLPGGTVGFAFRGEIRADDVDQVLLPGIEQAIGEYDRIKALLLFGDDFERFTLEAAWDDTSLGLRHWNGFERLAVVSDVGWLRQGVRALGLVVPYPVRLFRDAERDGARRWLSEALGTIHLQQQGDVISVQLIGSIDPEAYARVDDDLANLLSACSEPRLLLDLRDFEGWLGLVALRQHLGLLREYRRVPRRVAVVGAPRWQHLGQRLLSQFLQAKTRSFPSSELLAAQEWVAADSATP